MKSLLPALAILAGSLSPSLAQEQESLPPIVAEAETFMAAYADDIRRGDAAAVAARYDPDGAWMVQYGQPFHATHVQITERYLTHWEAPASFFWGEMAYIPAGPDAVSVVGRFDWTTTEGQVDRITYNGLLVRRDGALRIRMEDETPIPDGVP